MKTTINFTDKDLEVINWLKFYSLEEQGVNLNTTQVIKKCLYNEKYFLEKMYEEEKNKITG